MKIDFVSGVDTVRPV